MIKVFIPQDKRQGKTTARGFWRNKAGRIYYDYLREDFLNWDLSRANYKKRFYLYLNKIKLNYNQEAIFYTIAGQGFIYTEPGKVEALPHRIIKEVLRANLKRVIKEALKIYNGCTIYIEAGRYYIEIFYK